MELSPELIKDVHVTLHALVGFGKYILEELRPLSQDINSFFPSSETSNPSRLTEFLILRVLLNKIGTFQRLMACMVLISWSPAWVTEVYNPFIFEGRVQTKSSRFFWSTIFCPT